MQTALPEPYEVLKRIADPEIPVLTVIDLGMIRDVEVKGEKVKVYLSPTYNGCPAIDVIKMSIRMELILAGYQTVEIQEVLSPPWTTDWISEDGKAKLKKFGISPPAGRATDTNTADPPVNCPLCDSSDTEMISYFGSTACKALYKCRECKEPFDYFKCH